MKGKEVAMITGFPLIAMNSYSSALLFVAENPSIVTGEYFLHTADANLFRTFSVTSHVAQH
jgi:hypothetical protein